MIRPAMLRRATKRRRANLDGHLRRAHGRDVVDRATLEALEAIHERSHEDDRANHRHLRLGGAT
jgi:hypothetical protein